MTGASPSLVVIGQSRTRKSEWDRQQRRIYNRLKSFMIELSSRGMQIFRVDLTSPVGADPGKLSVHHKELRKRVGREFGYEIEHFQVQTGEGNGVLHCVWGVAQERAAYIPQAWLSSTWESIHGAHRVWIKRVSTKRHQKNAVGYMVNQYLAGQSSIVRCAYSWHKCKVAIARGWASLRRMSTVRRPVLWREQTAGGREIVVRDLLPMSQLVRAWENLLEAGQCLLDGVLYAIEGRQVVELVSGVWDTFQSDPRRWPEWAEYA